MVTDLPLQVGGLVGRGSGQNAGVSETRPEQHPHHEDEEDAADRRDGRGQVGRQEGTTADRNTRLYLNVRMLALNFRSHQVQVKLYFVTSLFWSGEVPGSVTT